MSRLAEHYAGKTVLLTGHTGFKGSWLAEWLLSLGAEVVGVALEPEDDPALFDQLELAPRLAHNLFDICDAEMLTECVNDTQPDYVFHLAAQSLVRYSYKHPLETFETNVLGTAYLLDALRSLDRSCAAVIVTTDKCYENRETTQPYGEDDPMGGHDPYSASKGAAELVAASYRRSFFDPVSYGRKHAIAMATARAGNVIGGGDRAADRIIPDCIRMLASGEPVPVRNPAATRPWQHVLEPLGGYLLLGARLASAETPELRASLCSGFNFGPDPLANRSVQDLVETILTLWPGEWIDRSDPNAVHEAGLLNLAIDKARALLGWVPIWDFETTIDRTVTWYRDVAADPACALDCTRAQISEYMEALDHEV